MTDLNKNIKIENHGVIPKEKNRQLLKNYMQD